MNHSHVLYDSDPRFKIDPISRKITNESSTKTTIVQHDHNSERFTFEVNRYVEGHDLSLCNVVEIHYLNIEANTKIVRAGVYSVDDLHVKDDDENAVVCSWLVPNNATQLVGQLQFLVRFSCVSDAGRVEYVWNTAPYTNISVSSGIYNSDAQSDNPVPPYNFVTTIDGQVLKFFVGTKAEYDLLTYEETQGLFAIITDDSTKEELFDKLEELEDEVESLKTNGVPEGGGTGGTVVEAQYLMNDGLKFGRRTVFSKLTSIQTGVSGGVIEHTPTINISEGVLGKYLIFDLATSAERDDGVINLRTMPVLIQQQILGNTLPTKFALSLNGNAKLIVNVIDQYNLSLSIEGSELFYQLSKIYEEY